ncbi:MAG: M20 family metallo-hydrolase [Defluviitaleaceae bacterium]|nr:M20 family metallo-hydrolase [Defluviitaleaceae bacterium]
MADLEVSKIIDEICELSKNDAGEITRFPFSESWMKAQTYLKELFEKLGFDTYFDCAGNLHGRIGTQSDTIMTGSHADTVRNGGKYDGLYGVVAAALAVSKLYRKYGAPKKGLEVIAFSEEEGTRFPFNFWGSKTLIGDVEWDKVKCLTDKEGIRMVEALENQGFSYSNGCAKRDDIKAFVEIHIEQGGVLEAKNMEIGVVTGIVGYKKFNIEIFGEANHAGTTPMGFRKDAGFCAGVIISELIKRAREYGDPLVTTIGQIEFSPNLANVVPAYAQFSLDMRHTDGDILNRFQEEALEIVKKITSAEKVTYNFTTVFDDKPVYMDKDIMDIITKACENQGVKYMAIHSGAGHDSQILARIAPVGMIFVPSKNGVSHNPAEFTEPELLEKGVSILEEALHKLAY